MQAKDVLIPARREELLDDFGAKWPDLLLMSFLADGIREMYALRADLLLGIDGTMGSNELYQFTGDAAQVRIANGRLEIWDTVLLQWIAVEFQDGTLAILDQSEIEGEPAWNPEDLLISMEADIGVSDSQLRFPLQEYVVYRALNVFAETVEETNKAETHLTAFERGLGVRR
jgi:hypothetical protein